MQQSEDVAGKVPQFSASPDKMTFGWPTPGIVHVKERVEKKGTEAKMAYELHLCKSDDDMLVRYENFRFLSVGGVSAADKSIQEGLKQALTMSKLIPQMRVDAKGQAIEMVGLRELMRGVLAELPDSDTRAMVETFMTNPQMVAMFEAKSSEVWSSWVSIWALFEPSGETTQSFAVEVSLPSGPFEQKFDIERVETIGTSLRLRLAKTEGNEQLEPSLMQILQPLLAITPNPAEAEKIFSGASIQRSTTWEVVTSPSSLRPSEADTRVVTTISIPGGEQKTRTETHHYDFDWETGRGQTPRCKME